MCVSSRQRKRRAYGLPLPVEKRQGVVGKSEHDALMIGEQVVGLVFDRDGWDADFSLTPVDHLDLAIR